MPRKAKAAKTEETPNEVEETQEDNALGLLEGEPKPDEPAGVEYDDGSTEFETPGQRAEKELEKQALGEDAPPEEEVADQLEGETEETAEETEEYVDPFTPDLLGIAAQWGFDAEAARAFGNPEYLKGALLERARQADLRDETTAKGGTNGKQPEAAPQGLDRYAPSWTEDDDVDPAIARVVGEMNDFYHGRVEKIYSDVAEAMKQILEPVVQAQDYMKAQQQQAYISWLNTKVKALGEDYVDVYGDKQFTGNPDETPENKRWFELDRQITLTGEKYKRALASGTIQSMPSADAIFDEANLIVSKGKAQSIASRKAAAAQQRQNARGISRPTSRQNAPPSGIRKAVSEFEKFAAEHGMQTDPEYAEEQLANFKGGLM